MKATNFGDLQLGSQFRIFNSTDSRVMVKVTMNHAQHPHKEALHHLFSPDFVVYVSDGGAKEGSTKN